MRFRPDPGDPELIGRPVDLGPLWAQSPPAGTEQRELPLPNTTEARFLAWLGTEDGARMYVAFCRLLLQDLANGERVSCKLSWELARRETKVRADNRYHALAIRRAEDEHPVLREAAEKRKRKSA